MDAKRITQIMDSYTKGVIDAYERLKEARDRGIATYFLEAEYYEALGKQKASMEMLLEEIGPKREGGKSDDRGNA